MTEQGTEDSAIEKAEKQSKGKRRRKSNRKFGRQYKCKTDGETIGNSEDGAYANPEDGANKKEQKKGKRIDAVDILCGVFFVFAYLFMWLSMFFKLTDTSIKMMRFLFVFGLLSDALLSYGIAQIFRKCQEKRQKKRMHVAVSVISAALLVLAFIGIFSSIPKMNQFAFQSNNAQAFSYTNFPSGFGNQSLESAIEKAVSKQKQENSLYDEIFRFGSEDRVWVYFQGENEVCCYEFRIEDERWYYIGSLSTTYYGFFEHNYSDIDTMRSDIEESNCIPYTIDAAPIWGVTENENAANIKINEVGIDFVKEIFDTDGGKYYFWLIQDGSFLKGEDVETLVIEGIEE